jgi:hypothetical protein
MHKEDLKEIFTGQQELVITRKKTMTQFIIYTLKIFARYQKIRKQILKKQ